MRRALAIYERVLGGQHPGTVTTRENYVILLREMGCEQEAREVLARFQNEAGPS